MDATQNNIRLRGGTVSEKSIYIGETSEMSYRNDQIDYNFRDNHNFKNNKNKNHNNQKYKSIMINND